MSDESATPSGAEATTADASAQPTLSIHERLKAHLAPPEPAQRPQPIAAGQEPAATLKAPAEPKAKPNEQVEGDDAPDTEHETAPEGDATEETEANYSSVDELAEALGWDVDKLLSLDAKTKIDGKEGSVRLRDLIKSHQLEGHLNQKLMTFAEDKKAFELERQNTAQQVQHKFQQIDAAVKVATKLLEGEYGNVNWEELRTTDPNAFNAKVVEYQHRQQALSYLANQIGQEAQATQAEAAKQQQAYLSEQKALLDSKMPEWSSDTRRNKDIAEMATVLSDAYGVTEAELRSVVDHRQLLIAHDAWKWQQLQKAKPAILNKVKTAPRLLKPGTTQSRTEQTNLAAKSEREKLRKTGSVRDATPLLKRLIFNQ